MRQCPQSIRPFPKFCHNWADRANVHTCKKQAEGTNGLANQVPSHIHSLAEDLWCVSRFPLSMRHPVFHNQTIACTLFSRGLHSSNPNRLKVGNTCFGRTGFPKPWKQRKVRQESKPCLTAHLLLHVFWDFLPTGGSVPTAPIHLWLWFGFLCIIFPGTLFLWFPLKIKLWIMHKCDNVFL